MSERYIAVNHLALWTIEQGAGYPIILCNGGSGCCDYLQPVADLLTDIARVIRFEQRGCGRSQPASHYSVETSIEDIEAVQNAYGIERCIVGGHSWGADLALVYALTYPERVKGLLLQALHSTTEVISRDRGASVSDALCLWRSRHSTKLAGSANCLPAARRTIYPDRRCRALSLANPLPGIEANHSTFY